MLPKKIEKKCFGKMAILEVGSQHQTGLASRHRYREEGRECAPTSGKSSAWQASRTAFIIYHLLMIHNHDLYFCFLL